jgi:hypothetical protein
VITQSFAVAPTSSAQQTRPIYFTERDNANGLDSSQCDDGGVVAPCREDVAMGVCASASEPCFYDPVCKEGGLGCNAAGFESCRFCGFGQYSSIACPGTTNTTRISVLLEVPGGACPRACTANAWETCFYDASCSDPFDPDYRGGFGCNAGGRGQNCRFCGFVAHNGTELHSGLEYWAGGSLPSYPECPDVSARLAGLHVEASAAMQAVGATGEARGSTTLHTASLTTLEVAVNGEVAVSGEAATPSNLVETVQTELCAHRVDRSSTCSVRLVSSSTQQIGGGRRRALSPTQIELLTIEVVIDPTEPDAARIDAALNNGTAVNSMLSGLDGVVGAGVTWNTSYTSRLTLEASLGPNAPSSLDEMRSAVTSAVAASLEFDVGAVRLRHFSRSYVPPTIVMSYANPNNPLNPGAALSPAPPPLPFNTPPFAPGQAPPMGSGGTDNLNPTFGSSLPMPTWGVAVIVGVGAVCACAALGLCLQLRKQRADGPKRKGLWPGIEPPARMAVELGSALPKKEYRAPSGHAVTEPIVEMVSKTKTAYLPSSFRENSFRQLDDEEVNPLTSEAEGAGLADIQLNGFRRQSTQMNAHV